MTALRLGLVGRLAVIITAVILSFAIVAVSVSADTSLSPAFYSSQWKNGAGTYQGYTYGASLSDLSYGSPGGYYLTYGSNNIGTIPNNSACTDLYIGNRFHWLENGSVFPFQPYYSYLVNYTLSARYTSSSARDTFDWSAVTLCSVLSSDLNQENMDESTYISLADYDYVGLLTESTSYIDSSFAPATYCTDYRFSVVFRLPGYYNPDTYKQYLITDFHFPITAFSGSPPSNSNYIFLKGTSITASFDESGAQFAESVDQIIQNSLAIGAIAHRDAEAIKSQIENSFGSLDSSIQDGFNGLGDLIQGEDTFDAGQDGYESIADDYYDAESMLLDAVGYDTLDIENMEFETLFHDLEVPDATSGSWWILTLNPIYTVFPFFVIFPLLLGLAATLLGRRYD